ncbi:MAG: polysaccharide biosynthesis protein [Bacteroidales bacterium]|jgi:FlaA1/EpsC-like NDP-sugar epimerase|nr:polysaccharide biosynthesis protein [Bacteroidales bacterium]
MFDINKFISKYITKRDKSLFIKDIEANRHQLEEAIRDKRVCVIGGAGSIGSSFIKALLPFRPSSLVVIDLSENGLVELTRDLRSTESMFLPDDYRTYTLDFADPLFEQLFLREKGFDIVANFSAHKHVRSERDTLSVQALIVNNVFKAKELMELLSKYPPKHFFCVSTDKAANPVNIMGASKLLMEKLVMSYCDRFPVTTARFANVAFSNGSLPDSWISRMMKKQPLVAPSDVMRYFVSPQESGEICMLACILGKSGEIFFPKLEQEQMTTFSAICDKFVEEFGYTKKEFSNENEARLYASQMKEGDKEYPVFYFKSDTTGEKDFEEFFVPGEKVDMESFTSLGVIKYNRHCTVDETSGHLTTLEYLFRSPECTKAGIVKTLCTILPNFEHEEKGKNLDQKM